MTNDDILTRIEELKTVIADQVVRFEVASVGRASEASRTVWCY